jgi:hypothetical protein
MYYFPLLFGGYASCIILTKLACGNGLGSAKTKAVISFALLVSSQLTDKAIKLNYVIFAKEKIKL